MEDLLVPLKTYAGVNHELFKLYLIEAINRPYSRVYPEYSDIDIQDLVDVLPLSNIRDANLIISVLPVTDKTVEKINSMFDNAILGMRASIVQCLLRFPEINIRYSHINLVLETGDYIILKLLVNDPRTDIQYTLQQAIDTNDVDAVNIITSAEVIDTSKFTSDNPEIRALLL